MKVNLIVIFYVFTMMFMIDSNPVKEEIVEIFNNIDVEEGIETIIEKSELEFDYVRSKLPLSTEHDETWTSKMLNHGKFKNDVERIELELYRLSSEKESNCYEVSLRVSYSNRKSLNSDYDNIISTFEELGSEIEHFYLSGRDMPAKFDSSKIKLGTEMEKAELAIGKIEDDLLGRLILFATFETCPDKYE